MATEEKLLNDGFGDNYGRRGGYLVLVEQIAHQPNPEESPVAPVNNQKARILESNEQHFGPRKFVAGPEWKRLDTGWVAEPSLLCIDNNEGVFTQVIPTEEQRKEAESKVVEIAVLAETNGMQIIMPVCLVRPGGFPGPRFEPADASTLLVRCKAGPARCTLVAFPR